MTKEERIKKEEELYNKLEQNCKDANVLIENGYLIYDKQDKHFYHGKFIFKSLINKSRSICIQTSKNSCVVFLTHGECSTFGEDTLLQEYKKAEKSLSKLILIAIESGGIPVISK